MTDPRLSITLACWHCIEAANICNLQALDLANPTRLRQQLLRKAGSLLRIACHLKKIDRENQDAEQKVFFVPPARGNN